jgi:hypothetical protein
VFAPCPRHEDEYNPDEATEQHQRDDFLELAARHALLNTCGRRSGFTNHHPRACYGTRKHAEDERFSASSQRSSSSTLVAGELR